jgi:hypothetical protein
MMEDDWNIIDREELENGSHERDAEQSTPRL